MKLCISGTRKMPQNDDWAVWVLARIEECQRAFGQIETLVHGDGKGVDWCAGRARELAAQKYNFKLNCKLKTFPANWDEHGKAAGPMRNRQMADYADALLALPAKSGSKGTLNTVREFMSRHKSVMVLWQDM